MGKGRGWKDVPVSTSLGSGLVLYDQYLTLFASTFIVRDAISELCMRDVA